jgi:hypothetical protein
LRLKINDFRNQQNLPTCLGGKKRALANGAGERIQHPFARGHLLGERLGERIGLVDRRLDYDPTVSMLPRKGNISVIATVEMAANPSVGEVSLGIDSSAVMSTGPSVLRHEDPATSGGGWMVSARATSSMGRLLRNA